MSYSKEIRSKALELFDRGYGDCEVAQLLGPDGPSEKTVSRWRAQGVVPAQSNRHADPKVIGFVVSHVVLTDVTATALSARLGINPATVFAWVSRYRHLIEDGGVTDVDEAERVIIDFVVNKRKNGKKRRQEGLKARRAAEIARIQAPIEVVAETQQRDEDVVVPDGVSGALYSVVSKPMEIDELPDDPEQLRKMLIQERDFRAAAEAMVVVLGKGQPPVGTPEKATIVNLLREQGFTAAKAMKMVQLAASTYHRFNAESDNRADRRNYRERLAEEITDICMTAIEESGAHGPIYGYRIVHNTLKQRGFNTNEKTVRIIMNELNLQPVRSRKSVYSSYEGENQHCPQNLVLVDDDGQLPDAWGQPSKHFTEHNAQYPDAPLKHDFHADHPGQRLVTDISELKAKDGKLYLSPLVDLFDGKVIAATAGCRPTAELVVVMLEEGLASLDGKACPIIHTDRGAQYRSQAWINAAGTPSSPRFIPSMSRKATSGDNAVAEGFFGLLKRDLFPTSRASEEYTIAELIHKINNYIYWYNEKRVRAGLGYKTIKQTREEYSRQQAA